MRKYILHPLVCSFLLGLVSCLAFAPFSGFFLLPLSVSGLLYFVLEKSSSKKDAFLYGFTWGMGHWLGGIYWMAIALLVDKESFGWLIPVGIPLLCGYFALYIACTTFLTFSLPITDKAKKILFFCALWIIMEYIRSFLFTGFPWNLLGYSFHFSLTFMQTASYTGIYGLSLLAILGGSIPYLWIIVKNKKYVTAIITCFLSCYFYGTYRLQNAHHTTIPDVHLRLVQPNIKQSLKWDPIAQEVGFLKHIRLSTSPGYENITHIIWPETAMTYALKGSALEAIKDIIPVHGLLLTGINRYEEYTNEHYAQWNSLQIINKQGEICGSFDKFHLTPFGEYVPLQKWLNFAKITRGALGLTPGAGPTTLILSSLPPFSPLICYEAIFPNKVISIDNYPQWMLNMTNDGWFGESTGPYQHFETVRMRAIEQGIPLIRVANTGISGVIDAYGRVVKSLELGKEGIIDCNLPSALATRSFYSRFGNILVYILLLLIILYVFSSSIKNSPSVRDRG